MKTFELSLTKTYVAHWGVAEGVRELVQNALDSDSPFVYGFTREDDDQWTLTLDSENAHLTTQSLLLGATTKAGSDDKIGNFGEGYKIALLVLTRCGKSVQVWNGPKIWTPFFDYSDVYETETLRVVETLATPAWKGLRYLVSNLTTAEVEAIKLGCLRMQESIGPIKQTQWGDILLDQKGRLYVGGLFITETEMDYGYNVKPEYLKLERDRQTVDSWDLANMTRRMWYATEEWDRIGQMIVAEIPDMQYSKFDAPQLVKEACYRWFISQHPDGIVASTQQELHDAIAKGMTKTVYVGPVGDLIKTSGLYKVEVEKVVVASPADVLQAFWAKAKFMKRPDRERAFKQLVEQSRKWRSS